MAPALIRGLSSAARSLLPRRLLYASSLPAANPPPHPHPLLAELLRHDDLSALKLALDSQELPLSRHLCDASFWAPLLSALRTSSPSKAQAVLEWKLEKLLQQDIRQQSHYSGLILLGAQYGSIQFAQQVFLSMEAHGVNPNTLVFNSLIYAFLSIGDVIMSLSLFEIMEASEDCMPDSVTYDAFTLLYSKKGDIKMMLNWHSSRIAAGFVSDARSYELLIAGFTKACNFQEADQLYLEMISSGITASVPVLECKLEGLCRRKKLSEIKEFLKVSQDQGLRVSQEMAQKLLNLYLDLGMVVEMEELLLLVENVLTVDIIALVHYGIIRLYALKNKVNDMHSAIERMLTKDIQFNSAEDIEAIICCYFRKNAYSSLDLFLELVSEKYTLARSTYDILVAGYRRAGLQERLDAVVKEMQNHVFN